MLELHRAIQERLAAGPAPVSSVDLALFLYTLLNPESRGVPRGDGESTNPIAGRLEPAAEPSTNLGRRRSDAFPQRAHAPLPPPATFPEEPMCPARQ